MRFEVLKIYHKIAHSTNYDIPFVYETGFIGEKSPGCVGNSRGAAVIFA